MVKRTHELEEYDDLRLRALVVAGDGKFVPVSTLPDGDKEFPCFARLPKRRCRRCDNHVVAEDMEVDGHIRRRARGQFPHLGIHNCQKYISGLV